MDRVICRWQSINIICCHSEKTSKSKEKSGTNKHSLFALRNELLYPKRKGELVSRVGKCYKQENQTRTGNTKPIKSIVTDNEGTSTKQ